MNSLRCVLKNVEDCLYSTMEPNDIVNALLNASFHSLDYAEKLRVKAAGRPLPKNRNTRTKC